MVSTLSLNCIRTGTRKQTTTQASSNDNRYLVLDNAAFGEVSMMIVSCVYLQYEWHTELTCDGFTVLMMPFLFPLFLCSGHTRNMIKFQCFEKSLSLNCHQTNLGTGQTALPGCQHQQWCNNKRRLNHPRILPQYQGLHMHVLAQPVRSATQRNASRGSGHKGCAEGCHHNYCHKLQLPALSLGVDNALVQAGPGR